MRGRNVALAGEVVAEDLGELGVAHLGLLETRDVRPALIEPGDETRLPRARGIDVPGGEPHQRSLPAPGRRDHGAVPVSYRRERRTRRPLADTRGSPASVRPAGLA